MNAHETRAVIGSPLQYGWEEGKFGLETHSFLPIPKKEDVVSHPVIACAAGKILQTTEFSDFLEYTHHF
jgi:hypothetical protein